MESRVEHDRASASAALGQIAAEFFGCRDTHAVLRQVVDAGRSLSGADAALVLLYDAMRDLFVPAVPSVAAGLDERWLQRHGLEGAQELARRSLASDGMLVEDVASNSTHERLPFLAGGGQPALVHVLPLWADVGIVGALELFHMRHEVADLDLAALRTFVTIAGLAIANGQAHEHERALRARLEALDEATKAIAVELSPGQVLRRIVEIAATIAGARYGALGVSGPDGYLIDFITTGLTAEQRAHIGALPRGHGLLGVLIRQGQSLRVPNIWHDPRRVGFPPHHPPMTSLLGVPVRVHNTVVGDLYLTDKIDAPEFSDDDQRLVEMLAAHAGIAIENARLYVETAEVTLLRERERIARDLHDGIIQNIYGATLRLEDMAEDAPNADLQARLTAVSDGLLGVIGDVRGYIQGLRARELAAKAHGEAIASLVRDIAGAAGLESSVTFEGTPLKLPDEHANTLLQIARESLTNTIRHARATRVDVALEYVETGVRLTLTDNGEGFDPDAARDTTHQGLRNLRLRAEEPGGSLRVVSMPGKGTVIEAFLPTPRQSA
jgi:signal transduction histidine kinase